MVWNKTLHPVESIYFIFFYTCCVCIQLNWIESLYCTMLKQCESLHLTPANTSQTHAPRVTQYVLLAMLQRAEDILFRRKLHFVRWAFKWCHFVQPVVTFSCCFAASSDHENEVLTFASCKVDCFPGRLSQCGPNTYGTFISIFLTAKHCLDMVCPFSLGLLGWYRTPAQPIGTRYAT